MVRRRMASPKPSPPVHRRAASPMSAPSPPSSPMQTHSAKPSATPVAAPRYGVGAPSQGPGLMGQMAATAGGVAIGSAVGHAVGNMISGGGNGGHSDVASAAAPAGTPYQNEQQYKNPCEFEWKQFMDCVDTQSDIGLCQGFNEIFKQCRAKFS